MFAANCWCHIILVVVQVEGANCIILHILSSPIATPVAEDQERHTAQATRTNQQQLTNSIQHQDAAC